MLEASSYSDRTAFSLLLADLVERLLALADNPARSADFIAEELRSLVGAKTVLVFQCLSEEAVHRHRLVSVFPERRRPEADRPGIEELLRMSHGYARGRIIERDDGTAEGTLLPELGVGTSLLLPLACGTKRVGAVLILDLFDRGTVDKALDALNQLSSVLALVLRNADLYATMEERVAERTKELESSLKEKEVLLKEVHHRVKNNLQVVLGLLYLKANSAVGEETRQALQESQERIYAMALAHEELYRSGNFSQIDLADYLVRIADNILEASCPSVLREYRAGSLFLGIKEAIPCGLIVSELVMNCAKHAFSGQGGRSLFISVEKIGNEARVEVRDDGPGFPERAPPAGTPGGGIGMDIVESLLDQLQGRLETSTPGTRGGAVVLRFPC
jgi:two-component sensor histidine kinase